MATYANPPAAFIKQYCAYGLIGVIGQSPSDPDFQLQFSSSSTSAQRQLVNNAAQTFDWVPYRQPPGPNQTAFMAAIMADPTISEAAQLGLATWYPQLQMFMSQSSVVKSGWAMLVSAYQSSWLTPAVQTSILAYAVQYNIPLQ